MCVFASLKAISFFPLTLTKTLRKNIAKVKTKVQIIELQIQNSRYESRKLHPQLASLVWHLQDLVDKRGPSFCRPPLPHPSHQLSIFT